MCSITRKARRRSNTGSREREITPCKEIRKPVSPNTQRGGIPPGCLPFSLPAGNPREKKTTRVQHEYNPYSLHPGYIERSFILNQVFFTTNTPSTTLCPGRAPGFSCNHNFFIYCLYHITACKQPTSFHDPFKSKGISSPILNSRIRKRQFWAVRIKFFYTFLLVRRGFDIVTGPYYIIKIHRVLFYGCVGASSPLQGSVAL